MSTTPEDIVSFLNELFILDPGAIHALCANRVPCNCKLADHPTVQVGISPVLGEEQYHVGLVGLLNGLFSEPKIAMVWDDSTEGGLKIMKGFCLYNKPENT